MTDAQGRKVRKTVTGQTQREMQDNAALLKMTKRIVPVRTQTIEELLKAFLDERFPTGGKGREYHEWTGKRLVRDLGDVVAGELTTPDVARWLRKLAMETRLSGRAVQMHRNNLRVLLGFARELGWVRENVAKDVRLPAGVQAKPKEKPAMTAGMARLVRIKEPDPSLKLLWWVLAELGLRPSEALRLTDRHLRFERRVWWLDVPGTKTEAANRTIPVPLLLAQAMRERPAGPMFTTEGRPTLFRHASKMWAAALKRSGLPHTNLYQLRKLALTRWIEKGMPDDAVKRLAGHTTVALTKDRYARTTTDRLLGAVVYSGQMGRYEDPLG